MNKNLQDKLSLSDVMSDVVNGEDAEMRQKYDERKKKMEAIREKSKELLSKPVKDDEFCREVLKNLTVESMEMFAILKDEMEENPSPRAAETAASLVNSIGNTLKELRDIDTTSEKLNLEKQKLNIKASQNDSIGKLGDALVASTMKNLLKTIRDNSTKEATVLEIKSES